MNPVQVWKFENENFLRGGMDTGMQSLKRGPLIKQIEQELLNPQVKFTSPQESKTKRKKMYPVNIAKELHDAEGVRKRSKKMFLMETKRSTALHSICNPGSLSNCLSNRPGAN